MTQFSKIFVLFSVVASILFLAVVSVQRAGGISWKNEAEGNSKDDPIVNYQFDKSGGEITTYSAKNRITDANVGSPSPILAKKIIETRKEILTSQASRLTEQIAEIEVVQKQLDESKKLIVIDETAIEERQVSLEKQLQEIQQQIADTQESSGEESRTALKKQTEAEQRRLDVYRLRNELHELRTDHYRAIEQLKKLDDALIRLKGKNTRLEERHQQLKK